MSELYVSNSIKIIELLKYCRTIFTLNAKPGDLVHIVTDTRQDPLVWKALAAAAEAHGCTATISVITPRPYHQAPPTPVLEAAMMEADININASTRAMPNPRGSKASIIIMEEVNVERLTTGGATMTADEYRIMYDFGLEVQKRWLAGSEVHITSEFGTDLTCKIRDPKTDKVHAMLVAGILTKRVVPGELAEPGRPGHCAFPDGEVNVRPVEGTGNGTIVWDTSCHYPAGLLTEPVKLTVEDGWLTKIEGGTQAKQFEAYLTKYGGASRKEISWKCPSEIAIGINPKAFYTGVMRTDKKALGGLHVATGFRPGAHSDGIIAKSTVLVDGEPLVLDGVIQVGSGRPEF